MSNPTHQMDDTISRLETSRNDDKVAAFAYCTSDHVRIGLCAAGLESAAWVDRQQVIEFIAILSHIVYSKPAEVVEPAEVKQ